MSALLIKGLLQERRRRAVAEVMGSIERSGAWPNLSETERKSIRTGVFGAVNGYHDLALDLLKVMGDDTVLISERAVRMIEDLHRDLQYEE